MIIKSKTTILTAYPYMIPEVGRALYPDGCQIVIEFTETGYRVIKDNRPTGYNISGYLHIEDGVSAEEITDPVRDQIIKYYYNHPQNLPGIGVTPQRQYLKGIGHKEREAIGNNMEQGFYA